MSCDCGRRIATFVRSYYCVSYVQVSLSRLNYLRHTTSFGNAWPQQQANLSFSGADAGYRILIVDGNHTRRAQRRQFLEAFGYTIIEAENGREAVETVLSARPQLILMNYVLADMNGLQATELIRRQLIEQDIILMDSASNEGERWREALRGGCNGYLQEPCFKLELLELVKGFTFLLGERQSDNA